MCKIQIPEGATLDEKRSLCFDALYNMNLGDKVEKKDNLSYLTWSEAWKAFREVYPSATFRVITNPDTKLPYFVDPNVGIMVFTEVTADDLTLTMFLPVMNSSNRAMKLEPYNYQVWDKQNRRYVDKTCEAATMFDVNKTIMRCLVKNLAMFGLGLYIYAGDDLPEKSAEDNAIPQQNQQQTPQSRPQIQTQEQADPFAGIRTAINGANDVSSLMSLYLDHQNEIEGNPSIKQLLTSRKLQLQQAA